MVHHFHFSYVAQIQSIFITGYVICHFHIFHMEQVIPGYHEETAIVVGFLFLFCELTILILMSELLTDLTVETFCQEQLTCIPVICAVSVFVAS